ncbi:MAG: response regulator transcription factor [Betaproteobacteria bacterium]|nr:response regulator transcription factor [Betaproteobacteria bacterium]
MPNPIRILIADDHPLFREGVAHSLGADPELRVIAEASSAEEAVELAGRLSPDLVMLDITMPAMGGIDAAAKIASQQPGVRIMMLTVSEEHDNLFAALKAGAHGYVLKGVSAADLRAAVRRIAGGDAYITPELAAELVFEFSRPRASDPLCELTTREIGVLDLISRGLTNREIGEQLHLAEKTVKHYVTVVLQKLHVRSRTEAALVAVRRDAPGRASPAPATPARAPHKR